MAEKFIKKIKLTDGSTYFLYDANAPRKEDLNNYLPLSGGTITGNLEVDELIVSGKLQVDTIEYQSTETDNVLIQASDGTIKKRSADKLLEDIGGFSCAFDSESGALSLKLGRQ